MKTGRRPTAILTRDPWFGNRNPLTGEKVRDVPVDTTWDIILLDIANRIQSMTDNEGIPFWMLNDESIIWHTERKINYKEAAKVRAQDSAKNKTPGAYYTAKPSAESILPSYSEFLRRLSDKKTGATTGEMNSIVAQAAKNSEIVARKHGTGVADGSFIPPHLRK